LLLNWVQPELLCCRIVYRMPFIVLNWLTDYWLINVQRPIFQAYSTIYIKLFCNEGNNFWFSLGKFEEWGKDDENCKQVQCTTEWDIELSTSVALSKHAPTMVHVQCCNRTTPSRRHPLTAILRLCCAFALYMIISGSNILYYAANTGGPRILCQWL